MSVGGPPTTCPSSFIIVGSSEVSRRFTLNFCSWWAYDKPPIIPQLATGGPLSEANYGWPPTISLPNVWWLVGENSWRATKVYRGATRGPLWSCYLGCLIWQVYVRMSHIYCNVCRGRLISPNIHWSEYSLVRIFVFAYNN
jgi:hypothetical protein